MKRASPLGVFRKLQRLLLAVSLGTALAVEAQPGSLDPSFNGTGLSRLGFGGLDAWAYGEAVQSDGKMVLAGMGNSEQGYFEFELMRFGTNNLLDSSFGVGGKVTTAIGDDSRADVVAVQTDGKIVAAGYGTDALMNSCFALARYNTNGTLDSTFGNGGTVLTDLGGYSYVSSIAIQPDGKIVVVGTYENSGSGFEVARYLTNGALDTSFNVTGIQTTGMPGSTNGPPPAVAQACAMMLDGAGNIVAVGTDGYGDFATVRYTPNGELDSTFGVGGLVITAPPKLDYDLAATAVITLPGDGAINDPDRILVGGSTTLPDDDSSTQYYIYCYNENGSRSTSFGNGGMTSLNFSANVSLCGLMNQGNGLPNSPRSIIVGGTLVDPGFGDNGYYAFFLARLTAGGTLDTTFGEEGVLQYPFDTDTVAGAEAGFLTYQGGTMVLGGLVENAAGGATLAQFEAIQFDASGVYTNYGNGGIMTGDADSDSHGAAIAVQPDGKMVVAGGSYNLLQGYIFALARYNADGSLDPGFGTNGMVTLTSNSNYQSSAANAVLVESNGDIVTAGYNYNYNGSLTNFALARLTSTGLLDTNLGGSGMVITSVGASNSLANAVAVQPDGKLLAAGYAFEGPNSDFALVRYTTNGQLDTSFNGNGIAAAPIFSGNATAWAMQVQSNGYIVVAGQAQTGSVTNFTLVRYTPSGALDSGFGSSGIVTTSFGSGYESQGTAMLIQPDGGIVVAGPVSIDDTNYVALARYTTGGALDSSFGTEGTVIIQPGHSPAAVALQQDGKILVAGSAYGPTAEYFVMRFTSTGELDPSYGIGGEADISFNDNGDDIGMAATIDSVGRVAVAGEANYYMGVTRLQGDALLKFLSITATNSAVELTGLGFPGVPNTLSASTNLQGTFSPLGSVVPDVSGSWQYSDATAAGVPVRFYRLSYP